MCLRIILSLLLTGASTAQAETVLIENGVSRSEIVISTNPTRTQQLAAVELQTYLEKITGARLAIVDQPSNLPVKIFVGESSHTEKLGITSAELEDGAYRIVSGDDWMVLIGNDTNFTPIEPWPRGYNDIRSGKMQAEWNRITGRQLGYMHSQLHKHYSGRNSLFGTPNEQKTDDQGNVHVWTYDERGSFNAVCGFLRDLGVRWYMPGEIGEVVPPMKTISLPRQLNGGRTKASSTKPDPGAAGTSALSSVEILYDTTVRPDFPMRILNFRPAVYGRDVMMWGFRLGVRQPYGRQAAHGLHGMTDNEQTLKNHPEWFALYGGQRHNRPNIRNNQLCYSNDELFREAVEFARKQLDHFRMDVVSIMPPDGYTAICQCERCQGRESPELGSRGRLSNYVWDFVNRVAREVGKTHPDKKISNCAYGIYTEPPSNIEKLEPNVQVIIVGGRRPTSPDRDDLRRLRAAWQTKTDNPVEIFENYPFTGRGFYLPAYIPHVLGDSINETKGQSRGEDIWITMDFKEDAVGYNHFLLYFTARMYWGGKNQDAGAMFDEYVEKFYGPAAPEMMAFFSYCEQHWREMEKNSEKASRALDLFAKAKSKANRFTANQRRLGTDKSTSAPDSGSPSSHSDKYVRRIELIDNYLNGLRSKAKLLAQKRGPVPKVRLVSGADQRGKIVVDGKLNDDPWRDIPSASVGSMRELQTGQLPTYGTRFMTEWTGNDLYFAIKCEERPGEKLNIATVNSGDQAIWYGDVVEIELATDVHSYYQIVINPAGAIVDLDRGAPRHKWFNWSSKAEVATHVADDHWTVEVRIPITQDSNDPLHQVVGHKPTQSLPWHINLCRQRIRDSATEYSAFSPTGSTGFHNILKFGHFYAGRSHRFEADSTVTDFVIGSRAAEQLVRARKWNDALNAYLELAKAEDTTDFQKSVALRDAASCAMSLKDFEQADNLAAQIPLKAIADTVRMQTLAAQRKWADVVSLFGKEDLTKWPFWQIADAAFVRGKSHYFTKNASQAETDLKLALAYEPETRVRISIRTMMAHNRETHLGDVAGALALYRLNYEGKQQIGGADEFRSVDRAAYLLADQGKFEEALAAFDVVDFQKLTGFWLHEMRIAKGRVQLVAGQKTDAKMLLNSVIDDGSATAQQLRRAKELLQD